MVEQAPDPEARSLWQRLTLVQPGERRDVALSTAYFFFLLASYFILRPLRDQMGLVGDVKKLPWLWMGTLAGTLIVSPLFAWVVSRWPRRVSLPIVYRVCELILLAFLVILLELHDEAAVWAARAFFVWVSVFNMFAVSVFWGFLADVFGAGQARRLFGLIGVGGTLGAIAASGAVLWLAPLLEKRWSLPVVWLLVLSVVLLEIAVQCMRRIRGQQAVTSVAAPAQSAEALGGSAWDGVRDLLRSRYLLAIGLLVLAVAFAQSFLEFQKSNVVDAYFKTAGMQTGTFGSLELCSQSLTLVLQLLVTGRVLRRFGIGLALLISPVVAALGFVLLGTAHLGALSPVAVMFAFYVAHRGLLNGIFRPGREALFTLLPREQKYKAKNFIDTFVFRGGDALAAGAFGLLQEWLSLAALAFAALPAVALWAIAAVWASREERRMRESTRRD